MAQQPGATPPSQPSTGAIPPSPPPTLPQPKPKPAPPLPVLAPLAKDASLGDAAPVLLRGATLLTSVGPPLPATDLLLVNGRIAAIGANLTAPAGATIVLARGKFVMPGIVDTHSHLGVFSFPAVPANMDVNEMTSPVTAQVRALDGINGGDLAIARAWRGGVTTVQVLPGSGNTIGGQGQVLKLRGGLADDMIFKDAPRGMKMAVGENPKRVYGSKGKLPSTRMGSAAVMREAFGRARDWLAQLAYWAQGPMKAAAPDADLTTRALAEVISGRMRVHVHGYLPHDFMMIFRVADEFGFRIASLQHALEGFRITKEILKRGLGVATFADLWGFKHEMYGARPDNAAILARAGIKVAIMSDHPVIEQRWLAFEAAKAVRYGLPQDEALRALTVNPAWMLGLDARIGTLEVGKDADVAVWSEHPLRIGAQVDALYIEGKAVYTRP